MPQQLTCPRCGGAFEAGHILDQNHGSGLAEQTKWQPGMPARSFWTGLKVKRRELLPVMTYRCVECGYLEMYARGEKGRG